MEQIASELDLPLSNILALFCKVVKKFSQAINSVISEKLRVSLENSQKDVQPIVDEMKPTQVSLEQDLDQAGKEVFSQQMQQKRRILTQERINKYDITG